MKCKICGIRGARPKYFILTPPIVDKDHLCDKCADEIDQEPENADYPYFNTIEEAELHAMIRELS